MSEVTAAHRFRKTVAGLCMIGAPILLLAAALFLPGLDSDEAAMAGIVAGDQEAYATSQFLSLAGWALLIVAVLGFMHMLRERGTAEGHIGGTLALIGSAAALAQGGFGLALWQTASVGEAQATSLLTAMNDSTLGTVVLFILPLGITLGGVVLAWGLYRRRFAAAWMAAAIGAAAIVFAVGSLIFSQALLIVATALFLVGSGALGMVVLRESVEDWEHTPEFRGFPA